MSEYVEKDDKNIFKVKTSGNSIKLKVDCQFGTLAKVSFFHNQLITVGCGKEKTIGLSKNLKGETIEFNGSSGNPSSGQIKIIHTIIEEGGNELIYTFPDDYSGSPDYDDNDQQPSYVFTVKFI